MLPPGGNHDRAPSSAPRLKPKTVAQTEEMMLQETKFERVAGAIALVVCGAACGAAASPPTLATQTPAPTAQPTPTPTVAAVTAPPPPLPAKAEPPTLPSSATLSVDNQYSEAFEIILTGDGNHKLPALRVPAGKTTKFDVPPGKYTWSEQTGSCMSLETLEVASGGVAAVECASLALDGCAYVPAVSCRELVKETATEPPPQRVIGSAKVEVKCDFGDGAPLDFAFFVGGTKVSGKFSAPDRTTTTFTIPAGKMRWHAFGDPSHYWSCEGGGDSAELELGQGETALLDCWRSAKMGSCCTETKKGAAAAPKPKPKKK
jgi:hypothetical protein